MKRLHRRGGCYKVQELRFAEYEEFLAHPPAAAYNAVYKCCWPQGQQAEAGEEEEELEGATSSSSSG